MTKAKKQPAKKAEKPAVKKVAAEKKTVAKKATEKLTPEQLTAKRLKEAKTTEAMDKIAKLLKQKKSVEEVKKETGCSKSYIYWAKRVFQIPSVEKAKSAAKQPTKAEKPAVAKKVPAKKVAAVKKAAAPKVEKKAEVKSESKTVAKAAEVKPEPVSAMGQAKANALAKLPEEKKRLEVMKVQYSNDQNGAPLNPMQKKALEAQEQKIKNLEILAK